MSKKPDTIRKQVMAAVRQHDSDALGLLLTEYPEVLNAEWIDRAVLFAASKGDITTLAQLQKFGVNLNAHSRTVTGNPIYRAAEESHPETIRWLHREGVPIETTDFDTDPLVEAAYNADVEVVKLLLELGADSKQKYVLDANCAKSAWSLAYDEGHHEICDLIDQYGKHPTDQPSSPSVADSDSSQDSSVPVNRMGLIALVAGHFQGKAELYSRPSPDFEIYCVQSNQGFPFQTLFTVGLADTEPLSQGDQTSRRAELLMHLPLSWDLSHEFFQGAAYQWPVKLFQVIAESISRRKIKLCQPHLFLSLNASSRPLGPETQQC